MRKLIWPVLFLLCLSLQMSLPQNQWFKFDLPLLLIYCLAMLKGAFAGGIAGFFVGLLQDLLTGGIFGFHILTRTAIGYYVGYTKEKVFKDSIETNDPNNRNFMNESLILDSFLKYSISLIFFSIVAGLSTFGFWGMIIGPAMVTFFISIMHLLKKYSDDFKENVS